MRDFRPRIVERAPSAADVDALLKAGHIAKALRRARAANLTVSQESINSTCEAMFRAGRSGELLALIGVVEVRLPYEVKTLLRRTFDAKDYHTFLKQAHRLSMGADLKHEVLIAIEQTSHRAPKEAEDWRRKFAIF